MLMIIQTPPNIPPNTLSEIQAIEQPVNGQDTSTLQKDGISDFVNKLVLGYLVKQSIRQNDAEGITNGVQILDLQNNSSIVAHNADTKQFAASVNKLPVAMSLLKELRANQLRLDDTVSWEASDVREGAGIFDQPGAPLQATWSEVITDMLKKSGNTAVRVAVNKGLGGAEELNNRWSFIPQLSNTRLEPLHGGRFYLGDSTPKDSLWSLTEVLKTEDQYSALMKDALVNNIYTDVGVKSQLAGNDYIVLANKIGLLFDPEGNNRHDVGIIYNTKTKKSYGYSFFTTSPHESPTATARAETSLKDMGRYVLGFSGDKKQQTQQQLKRQLPVVTPETRILY